jgi:hypothetical protein
MIDVQACPGRTLPEVWETQNAEFNLLEKDNGAQSVVLHRCRLFMTSLPLGK